jgi:O-antigen ligase
MFGLLIIVLTMPSIRHRVADLRDFETSSREGAAAGPASALGTSNSFQWRLALWRDTVAFAAASPWLGHGLGSFPNLAVTTRIGLKIAAHNDYLKILVEMGIAGLFVFFWLHYTVLRGAWRVFRRYGTEWQSIFALAFIGLYLAILVISISDNVLSFHTVGWYLWAYAAAVHQL